MKYLYQFQKLLGIFKLNLFVLLYSSKVITHILKV